MVRFFLTTLYSQYFSSNMTLLRIVVRSVSLCVCVFCVCTFATGMGIIYSMLLTHFVWSLSLFLVILTCSLPRLFVFFYVFNQYVYLALHLFHNSFIHSAKRSFRAVLREIRRTTCSVFNKHSYFLMTMETFDVHCPKSKEIQKICKCYDV